MKKQPRKLRLAAQSIRTLATSQLGDVAAGCDTTSYTTDPKRTTIAAGGGG